MVKCGIDRIEEYAGLFAGKRLAMVTSASGVTLDGRRGYVVFHEKYPLRYLFSPEHGLHIQCGNGEDVQEQEIDMQTGARVVSLYSGNAGKHIPVELMEQLDAVVYDIQDLGTRFYTYIATMMLVMEDCAAAGKELIILDRPAPLGGEIVEGGLLQPQCRSFVGPYELCTRYALTVGELAGMVNQERGLSCRLHVVPCEGWNRRQMWPDTGNQWTKPSTAIRDFETALLYPGICLFEGTNISEGRGTGHPFSLVGAPFVEETLLCREMEKLNLPGVEFTPVRFTPSSSKFSGRECGGVRLKILDRRSFRTVATGLSLLYKIMELWPEKVEFQPSHWSEKPMISLLSGCDVFEKKLPPLEELISLWDQESAQFARRKQVYHIYQ